MVKRALITGASGAIGAAIARALAREGYHLILHYNRSREAAQVLASSLEQFEVELSLIRGDFSQPADLSDMVETLEQQGLEISLLVNNAGISEWGLLTDLTAARYHAVMSTNFQAVLYLCKAFLPSMVRKKSGVIINVASMWGACGASCEAVYAASKAACISLTKSLAREYGPSGIRVNAVAPGVISSHMLARFTEDELQTLAENTPLCRLGKAEEVAAAVVFLASEQASFITGQCLFVDGGYSA